jgi:membrane-bound inhibitor of C-type lysozyme
MLLASTACSRPLATTTYLCEGGDSIVAGFGPRYAELHLPPDRVLRLPPEPAASGAKYSDGRYTLHTKGTDALLERGGDAVLRGCRSAVAPSGLDSALTPRRAWAIAESIDVVTAAADSTVRTLQPERRGWQPRVLRLWSDSGRPVRLSVTEPTAAGIMDGLTNYYFVGGHLEVVRGPVTQYVFRDTTLIFWTTDSLQPLADIPLRDMVARQNFVLGEVRQYLAMFGVER